MNNLTGSPIDRQNILNNQEAIDNIRTYLGIDGMYFEGELRFTKQQIIDFYDIENSTIQRYLNKNLKELNQNGYRILKGTSLQNFKKQFGSTLKEGLKAPSLGVFNFRAFLNLGMLLAESEKAKLLRGAMLDIVIETLNLKTGGSTKYINQRDEDFFIAIIKEPHYRREFTTALNLYLEMGNYKYSLFTDEIYKVIFRGDAVEYKQILQLKEQDNMRDTMYAEVLRLIASFEAGIAHEMKLKSEELGKKLSPLELTNLITKFSKHPLYAPYIDDARNKMASRDYGFRRIIHEKLIPYIQSISKEDFDRFLGDKSKELGARIQENIGVFYRLKNR